MNIGIITPTFEPHFKYVDKMLKSMIKYVTDKKTTPVYFTISDKEKYVFLDMIKGYQDELDIRVVIFEEVLEHFGIHYTSEELLKKYGKFSFQTLKKFYTMLYVDADYFLVLDSESMWVKETNMQTMFREFFEKPFIAGTEINKYSQSEFNKYVNSNIDYLLDFECGLWFLEHFVWFYDKKILLDLFDEIGSPIDAIDRVNEKIKKIGLQKGVGVFEIALYQNFIYKYHEKYGYDVIDIDDKLKEYLGETQYNEYMKRYYEVYDGNCGLIERTFALLNTKNWKCLAQMFTDLRLNIIRCDYDIRIDLQRKFFKMVQPNILAASQEHFFGVNDSVLYIVKQCVRAVMRKTKKILRKYVPFIRRKSDIYDAICKVPMIHYDIYNIDKRLKRIEQNMVEDEVRDEK